MDSSISKQDIDERKFKFGLVCLFVLSQVLVHLIWGQVGYKGAIQYHAGEAYEAYHAAINLDRFGLQWGGLQDMATSPEAAAHPYLYIHHPNFGLYFSFVLQQLGFTGFELQMALSTLLWSTGIVAFALLVHTLTRTRLFALAASAMVGLDPGNALKYGCNIHRANDFGAAALVVLTAVLFLKRPGATRALGLILSLALAAGADYIMFIFLTGFVLLLALINGIIGLFTPAAGAGRAPSLGRRLTAAALPVMLFGLAALAVFSARQVQVIVGAGREVWVRDFLYQVLNRTHNESLYRGQWSNETTAFYATEHILNPGFAPKNEVSTRFEVAGRTLSRNLWLYFIGNRPAWSSTLGQGGAVVFIILGLVVLALFIRVARPAETGPPDIPLLRNPIPYVGLAVLVGLAAMNFLMPTYFTQWFPAFRLPLFLSTLLATLALARWRFFAGGRLVGALLAVCLVGKLTGLPPALQAARTTSLDHAGYCRALTAPVTYCNFTSASVSCFSRQATCVPTYDGFIKLATQGRLDAPADFFFLLERDRVSHPGYHQPGAVLLFKRGDQRVLEAMKQSPHFRQSAEGRAFIAYERIQP